MANIVVFRVGGDDAAKLETEMTPLFKAKDMINLATQEFYIKETIDGETYDPFSAETLKIMPAPHPSYKKEIIELSRQKYAMQREDVGRMLKEEEDAVRFGNNAGGEDDAARTGAGAPAPVRSDSPRAGTPPEPLI